MENSASTQIYNEYLKKRSLYFEYCKTVEHLIKSLLKTKGLSYHSITYRVKDEESFRKKIYKKTDKYKSLEDITDIVGIRIITYYSDDVDEIAEVIKEQFEIDMENSIDKRKMLDPDRFGYLSYHYVIEMDKNRLELPEYNSFKGCKAEIQIRSILQHAWAEIEHDLGYKSSFDIPKEIKRDFYRLAGLLEIGDKEFKDIRENIKEYSKSVPLKIQESPQDVLLDKVSLKSYIEKSSLLNELNNRIGAYVGATIVDSSDYFISVSVKELHSLGFKTIEEIEKALQDNIEKCFEFARRMYGNTMYSELSSDIGLFYLCYIKIAMSGSKDIIYKYLEENDIATNVDKNFLAQDILKIYTEITN